ncbi:MAG: DNA methyltransferase [Candidatus Lokiarchaeia archaeon]
MTKDNNTSDQFITIQEAAKLFNKSIHNISYLVQYSRINKFYKTENENIINTKELKKTKLRINNSPLISLNELQNYYDKIRKREEEIINNIPNCNRDLLFFDVPEKVRTKHVHRLHPYMGKFIPQLVEYYLSRNFEEGDLILDPFVGSGTTLIEANVRGIKSIGMDISEFNCMIAAAKIKKYDLSLLKKEVYDIIKKSKAIYQEIKSRSSSRITSLDAFITRKKKELSIQNYETVNPYLNKWFAPETIKQMLIYLSLIPRYNYENLLKVLLSRSVRSARLTFHFELTRLKEPIYEPYVCHKHKNKVCVPTQSLFSFLERYSKDTIRRINEFSIVRTDQPYEIIIGDSGVMDLSKILSKKFNNHKIDGIITSPPYVGLINYHMQHIYAYELFNIEKRIEEEIGRQDLGTSIQAKEDYKEGIAKVFKNLKLYLKPNAKLFIVANDKWGLYPEIAELSGYKIVNRDERPVTKKASRERSFYSETIFHFEPNN